MPTPRTGLEDTMQSAESSDAEIRRSECGAEKPGGGVLPERRDGDEAVEGVDAGAGVVKVVLEYLGWC